MKYSDFTSDRKSKYNRMFVYVWFETSESSECKFGERWVFAGQDAKKEIANRVRNSLAVRKDLFDDGGVQIHSVWDVTEYAKKTDRYYKAARVDDEIRNHIGFRKGKVGEVHILSAEEMAYKVNSFLIKQNQPLPEAGLAAWQYRTVVEILEGFYNEKSTILMDACARSGKTIVIGATILESGAPLTIIASYVLTSFTSFKVDLSSFSQFENLELIEAADDDYKDQIKIALKAGKQVVVFLSLCKGGLKKNKRAQRLSHLFSHKDGVMLVVDEADYGAWKPGQCDEMVKYRRVDDKVILMTGTNSERAIGGWEIDQTTQVTYLEMLMEKKISA